MDDEKFQEAVERLDEAAKMESDQLKKMVSEIVPTYHPGSIGDMKTMKALGGS